MNAYRNPALQAATNEEYGQALIESVEEGMVPAAPINEALSRIRVATEKPLHQQEVKKLPEFQSNIIPAIRKYTRSSLKLIRGGALLLALGVAPLVISRATEETLGFQKDYLETSERRTGVNIPGEEINYSLLDQFEFNHETFSPRETIYYVFDVQTMMGGEVWGGAFRLEDRLNSGKGGDASEVKRALRIVIEMKDRGGKSVESPGLIEVKSFLLKYILLPHLRDGSGLVNPVQMEELRKKYQI